MADISEEELRKEIRRKFNVATVAYKDTISHRKMKLKSKCNLLPGGHVMASHSVRYNFDFLQVSTSNISDS